MSPPVLWLVLCRPSASDGPRTCLSRGSEPYTNTSSRGLLSRSVFTSVFIVLPVLSSFPARFFSRLHSLVIPFPYLLSFYLYHQVLYFFHFLFWSFLTLSFSLYSRFLSLIILSLLLSSIFSFFVLFMPHSFILNSFSFL